MNFAASPEIMELLKLQYAYAISCVTVLLTHVCLLSPGSISWY